MRVCPRHPSTNWQGSPRQRRTLRRRGLQQLALNSGITRRSAKMASIPPKAHQNIAAIASSRDLSLLRAGMSTTSAMNWIWGTSNCMITGTSTTLLKRHGHLSCTHGHVNHLVQSSTTAMWELGCLLHTCTRKLDRHNRDNDHLVSVLQLEKIYGFLNRTMGICLCATTGM